MTIDTNFAAFISGCPMEILLFSPVIATYESEFLDHRLSGSTTAVEGSLYLGC
jgi:hypothetical protein